MSSAYAYEHDLANRYQRTICKSCGSIADIFIEHGEKPLCHSERCGSCNTVWYGISDATLSARQRKDKFKHFKSRAQ